MSQVVIPLPGIRSWRRVAGLGALALLGLALVIPPSHAAIDRIWEPRTVADLSVLTARRTTLEQAIARTYAKGADQLHTARGLILPISDAEAAVIEGRGLSDLRAIRRSALVAIARAFGLGPTGTESYVRAVEPQLDAPAAPAGSAPSVLLAPTLTQIATRAAELSAQAADGATVEMTKPRPTPGPSPASSPGPSPRP